MYWLLIDGRTQRGQKLFKTYVYRNLERLLFYIKR